MWTTNRLGGVKQWIKKHLIDFFTQYFNQSVKIKYYDEPTLAVDKIKKGWANSWGKIYEDIMITGT